MGAIGVFACHSDLHPRHFDSKFAQSYGPNFAQNAVMLDGSHQHEDANETQSRIPPSSIEYVCKINLSIANLQKMKAYTN